jgi:hypothetical protein
MCLCVVKEENGKDGSIRQKGARVEGDAMRCGSGGGALVSVLPQLVRRVGSINCSTSSKTVQTSQGDTITMAGIRMKQ